MVGLSAADLKEFDGITELTEGENWGEEVSHRGLKRGKTERGRGEWKGEGFARRAEEGEGRDGAEGN